MHDSIRHVVVHHEGTRSCRVSSGATSMMFNRDVSTDVSIASLNVSLPGIDRSKKGLILLAQMRQDKLRKGLRQIFQSCTFNRSVTSPLRSFKHLKRLSRRSIGQCLQNVSIETFSGGFAKLTTIRGTKANCQTGLRPAPLGRAAGVVWMDGQRKFLPSRGGLGRCITS